MRLSGNEVPVKVSKGIDLSIGEELTPLRIELGVNDMASFAAEKNV